MTDEELDALVRAFQVPNELFEETDNRPIIVIAGNYQQYKYYLREMQEAGLKLDNAQYACEPRHLEGIRNVRVVRVGQWWNNPLVRKNDPRLRMLEFEEEDYNRTRNV